MEPSTSSGPGEASGAPEVAALYRYPVKGCQGVWVDRLELDEVGPVGDRRWMVVDPSGETFLSQRNHPEMVHVRVEPIDVDGRGGVRFQAPGQAPLEVAEPGEEARDLNVRVWADRVPARVADAAAGRWLSRLLGRPARLVHLPDRRVRPVEASRAVSGFPSRVALADGFPLTLLSLESVEEVNRRVGPEAHIGPERFRPNVVVRAGDAWAEDAWRRIRLGAVEVAVVKPCARCVVTTVDPETGEKGPEPLRTLATFRKFGDHVFIAQNALHRGPGVLRVGDPVAVLEEGTPRPAVPGTPGAGTGLAETIDVLEW